MAQKHIVLGITGGIAAFKILELAKNLLKNDIRVSVIMTENAKKIVPPTKFEKLGIKVYSQLFSKNFDYTQILEKRQVEHIELIQSADLLVIAPATANVLAKLAHGIADDYLMTSVLAATCPIIVCPSMNVYMWHHPATQENVQKLKTLGMQIIDPDTGMLACGYEGQGRLASLESIQVSLTMGLKRTSQLEEKTVLVTAGGTSEPIDDVRFITNRSSGKMGAAITEAAWLRGATVILLRSKTSVAPRFKMEECEFETADDLEELMKKYIPKADICFHTAAVSDYTVAKTSGKLTSDKKHVLTLTPRNKLIAEVKKWNPKITLIGFKAEAGLTDKLLISKAVEKSKTSGADFIAANPIDREGQGFGVDMNEIFLVNQKNLVQKLSLAPKRILAEQLFNYIIPDVPS